jgi:hypothetical protein
MKEFFMKLFSGADNATVDLGRILWAKMSFVYCGASVYAIHAGQAFSPEMWGLGAGAVLASGGAGLALKAKTEPSG